MAKRRKRKTQSSGAFATLFQIVLGGVCGAALASGWLILKPVAVVDSPPKADGEAAVRHAVVYQPGKLGLVRESQVRQKIDAILQQSETEVALSEQEINRWLATKFGDSSAQSLLVSDLELRDDPPSIRIFDDQIQIGLVRSASYSGKKVSSLVLQALGRFEVAGSGRVEFVPTKTYLGSCPIPAGLMAQKILAGFWSRFPIPDEFQEAWKGVSRVVVSDGRVRLHFGTAAPSQPAAPAPVVEEIAVEPSPGVAQSPKIPAAGGGAVTEVPEAPVADTSGETLESAKEVVNEVVGAVKTAVPANGTASLDQAKSTIADANEARTEAAGVIEELASPAEAVPANQDSADDPFGTFTVNADESEAAPAGE